MSRLPLAAQAPWAAAAVTTRAGVRTSSRAVPSLEEVGQAHLAQHVVVIVERGAVEADGDGHVVGDEIGHRQARPERRRRLELVLTETVTPRSARSSHSSARNHTPWARVRRSDRKLNAIEPGDIVGPVRGVDPFALRGCPG